MFVCCLYTKIVGFVILFLLRNDTYKKVANIVIDCNFFKRALDYVLVPWYKMENEA